MKSPPSVNVCVSKEAKAVAAVAACKARLALLYAKIQELEAKYALDDLEDSLHQQHHRHVVRVRDPDFVLDISAVDAHLLYRNNISGIAFEHYLVPAHPLANSMLWQGSSLFDKGDCAVSHSEVTQAHSRQSKGAGNDDVGKGLQ